VQIVKGVHLRPGDYVWASGPEPHGTYEYPEDCVVFASFRGLSARYRYDGSPAGRSSAVACRPAPECLTGTRGW